MTRVRRWHSPRSLPLSLPAAAVAYWSLHFLMILFHLLCVVIQTPGLPAAAPNFSHNCKDANLAVGHLADLKFGTSCIISDSKFQLALLLVVTNKTCIYTPLNLGSCIRRKGRQVMAAQHHTAVGWTETLTVLHSAPCLCVVRVAEGKNIKGRVGISSAAHQGASTE